MVLVGFSGGAGCERGGGGGHAPVRSQFPRATDANDRVLGTELAGALARWRIFDGGPAGKTELDGGAGSAG